MENDDHSFDCNICEEKYDTIRDLMNHKKKQHWNTVVLCWKFASGDCSYADTDCWFQNAKLTDV